MNECPICGKKHFDSSLICSNCNSLLTKKITPQYVPPFKNIINNKMAATLRIIGWLIFVFGIIGSLLYGDVFKTLIGISKSLVSGFLFLGLSEIIDLLCVNTEIVKIALNNQN